MIIKEYLKLAARNLKRRGLRSWLTIVGIFISISIIFILVSLSLGLNSAIETEFQKLGTDKLFIQAKGQLGAPGTGGAVELTDDDVEVVERVSGVDDLSYYTAATAEVEFASQKRFVNGIGMELDKLDVIYETNTFKIQEGRLLEKGDSGKVVIGNQYQNGIFFKRPVEVGDKISINGKDFQVKGILQSLGNAPDDRSIYLPLDDFRDLFNTTGERVDFIFVKVGEGQDIQTVADRIDKKLLSSRDLDEKERDFTISTPEELLESFNTILNILTGFLIGVAAISLLVSGIGIANTMYTSVLERTKEIGVMKAVGARNSDILLIFTIEAGLLGAIGGAAGVILGIIAVKIIEAIAKASLGTHLLQAAIPFYLVAGCIIFSFVIGAVSGTLPSWAATKIKPVEALRYE